MKIKVVAVGNKMPDWVKSVCADYRARIQARQPFELIEVPAAKRSKNGTASRYILEEQAHLTEKLAGTDYVVAMDVKGKALSTEQLAQQMADWQMRSLAPSFVIGGPDGLGQELISQASLKLSLSALTLPHTLARIVLIEQIYRALTINWNHPYHRS